MQVSEQGIALIKQFEGFSPKPYLCPAGKPTIGYGHVIRQDESLAQVTAEQAISLLQGDVDAVGKLIEKMCGISLEQNEFDALVSLVFNIGGHAFEKSTLLRFLNAKDKPGASRQFLRWVYINGNKNEGLMRRRAAEKALFDG